MHGHVYLKNVHLQDEKKEPTARQTQKNFIGKTGAQEKLNQRRQGEIRLQTNQEFNQNKIKEIAKKYNVVHFNSRRNDDHAVGAEQKIRELKNRLKNFERVLKTEKFKPNKALKKATKI